MKRRRVWHLTLEEFAVEISGGCVETARRDNPAAVHRVLVRVTQCDKLVVADEFRKRETRGPTQCLDRLMPCAFQRLSNRRQFGAAWGPIKPADARINRMDLATAEQA